MKPLQVCPNCGKEFRPPHSKKNQRMCSVACAVRWKHSPAGRSERFWSKVDRSGGPDACWKWIGNIDKGGYGKFSVGPKGADKWLRAHRFAYEMSNPPLGDLLACHRCDNPSCVNPAHIFAGTNLDNIRDCISKGRHRVIRRAGVRIATLRSLTEDEVREIRGFAAGGESHESIAKRYPVQRRQISRIVQGTRCQWVT